MEQSPTDDRVAQLRSEALAAANAQDWEKALSDYDLLTRIAPQDAEAAEDWYGKGVAHYYLGDMRNAAEALEQCLVLDPQHPNAGAVLQQLRGPTAPAPESAPPPEREPVPEPPPAEPRPPSGAPAAEGPPSVDFPQVSLVDSFSRAWSAHTRNVAAGWDYAFSSIGALLSGTLFQFALAYMDFCLRAADKQENPAVNKQRYLSLRSEELSPRLGGRLWGFGDVFAKVLVGLAIAAAVLIGGAIVMALAHIVLQFIPLIGPLLTSAGWTIVGLGAAYAYLRYAVVDMLADFAMATRFGGVLPSDQIAVLRAQYLSRYGVRLAVYSACSGIASAAGVIACFVGVFYTAPLAGLAQYLGLADSAGVQLADLERFLGE